jgi:UV DNA damage endonuclease
MSRAKPTVAPTEAAANKRSSLPHLGLVCITVGPEVRYRTTTRTRFLALADDAKRALLDELYRHNIRTLFNAIDYCAGRGIRLYRVTSNLFPQVDHEIGKRVREMLGPGMSGFAAHAQRNNVRVVIHPDQWVVINSESPTVVGNSIAILQDHARTFDLLGLSRSSWSTMLIHGGKGGRPDELVAAVEGLPENIRARFALENDESCYSAAQILNVCRRACVPMVFDAHHHVVREKLDSYEHRSVREMTLAARETWRPQPDWQLVHISNGDASFTDPRHSEKIKRFPTAFLDVPWVEVEAKGKEEAILPLRKRLTRAR